MSRICVEASCHNIRPCSQHGGMAYVGKRPSRSRMGYTRAWQAARATFLLSHPRCTCGAQATVVDHVVPHRGSLTLFWDRTNWAALCVPCHNRKTGEGA